MNISDVTYCINGQIAIDTCKDLLQQALATAIVSETIKPLSLVILDF